ncbi:hypothetical protein RchiOBHm_Chr2g0138341 [Rosa chinensis]|uniref:Uncharacterized protein n=1 Tax=Rosa chinensis TaxID=74649 RepID=A0A2P6RWU5_ROSCH|nr:hypothetical protein RchiOBHm_Chr2g0138341 [Rosa chinensis]
MGWRFVRWCIASCGEVVRLLWSINGGRFLIEARLDHRQRLEERDGRSGLQLRLLQVWIEVWVGCELLLDLGLAWFLDLA